MSIIHKFYEELVQLEENHFFCGKALNTNSNILIIGTFNPSNSSCQKTNNAEWFYGRKQSKFWRYLPSALTGESLHINDNPNVNVEIWKQYCLNNKIVIIDLIKLINSNELLPNFGDREVEMKIEVNLSNTNYFNISDAFKDIKFNKVIYSLNWSDKNIYKLKEIRDIINQELIQNGCINNAQQIKYCKTPSRNDAYQSWYDALNN
jgi:hypothetical protein